MTDLQMTVAQSADAAELHANVPTLLLEMQTLLGSLGASVVAATDRGRRPFRPSDDWQARLGDLAYSVFLLADQTGVDVEAAIQNTARLHAQHGEQTKAADDQGWPFGN